MEFVRNPDHVSPEWPEDYWPDQKQNASTAQWQATINAFRSNQLALEAIIRDRQVDLLADLSHAEGYTILREILLVSDHNAYHIGELAVLRQVMGVW